jgi:protein phosphatase
VRKENQDQFLIATLHKLLRVHQASLADDITPLISDVRGFLFLVADGVGGRPTARRRAARRTDDRALRRTSRTSTAGSTRTKNRSSWPSWSSRCGRPTRSVAGGVGEDTAAGAGRPPSVVAALWPRAYLVQVGDSRCYRLRDGRLELMSKDQTVAQALVDSGALTQTEARRSPLRGCRQRARGPRATPMTRTTEIRWNDVMLLCTDGLTKHVTDQEIRPSCASSARPRNPVVGSWAWRSSVVGRTT